MARNRKNQSAAIQFSPALKAIAMCLMIGGAGVGYVWQKTKIYELGKTISKRETTLRMLQDQNEKLRRQLAMLRSPGFLEMRIKDLKLGLVQPQPAQIWRLTEPVDLQKPEREKQFAVQQARLPSQ